MGWLKGSIVALSTPFDDRDRVNERTLAKLFEFHKQNGTDAILLAGTTGESATLTEDEKLAMFEFGKREAGLPIIAGTGTNSTEKTVEFTKKAEQIGVDACLVITPYYNKPTQGGLIAHFTAVASAVGVPIIIYNVPGRTGVNILPETVKELSSIPNIVGIKEASGNLHQISEMIRITPDDFVLLSGDDNLTLPILCLGGDGVISVTANIAPKDMSRMVNAGLEGDFAQARELHHKLFTLTKLLFIETNPIPVKTALREMGFDMGRFRLPLVEMKAENKELLLDEMRRLGLL